MAFFLDIFELTFADINRQIPNCIYSILQHEWIIIHMLKGNWRTSLMQVGTDTMFTHNKTLWDSNIIQTVSTLSFTVKLSVQDRSTSRHWTRHQRMRQPPFSLNGLSLCLANPFMRTSLSACCCMYFIISATDSDTVIRCMPASTLSCSTSWRCACSPSWNLLMSTVSAAKQQQWNLTHPQQMICT